MCAKPAIAARPAVTQLKPYSPGKPIWEVQREHGLTNVVKLASNENPLGPSPRALEAIARLLPELHRYPDVQAAELKEKLAVRLGVTPGNLIVTNGGDELITLLSETFLEPGDQIVVPSPVFGEYEFGALLMGAEVIKTPLTADFGYDAEALLAAVTPRTKLVYLCSPHNPAGTYLPQAALRRLLHALPEGVLVVLDGAYSHYATAGDYTDGLSFVREGYPVLALQTFSKIYGLAGLRVGFGAAPADIIAQIMRVKEPFNVNALAQAAALAALDDVEHVRASQALNAAGKGWLYGELSRLGVPVVPSQSNFVLARTGPDAAALCHRLQAAGVIVRSGETWGLAEHVRITVGLPEENERLIAVLGSLLKDDRRQ